jgi:hypothetical protein
MTDTDTGAADFADFLGNQLNAKGARRFVIRDPNAPQTWEPVAAAGTPDNAGQTADNAGADNAAATGRDALISGVIQKHGLHPDDADLLAGIPDADLDEAAERLAALIKEQQADPNAPRRPQVDRAQGQNPGMPPSDPAAEFGKWIEDRLAGR